MTLFKNFSFWLQRAVFLREVDKAVKNSAVPVIVYQMGKVASTSVTASLRRTKGLPVFQVHRLCGKDIQAMNERRRAKGLAMLPVDAVGAKLAEQIIDAKRPAKIITLVREPIGRNISAYFENLIDTHRRLEANENIATIELIDHFLANYRHSIPLTWFDDEFKKALGIDVYAFPFEPEVGYTTISSPQFDILILRCDLPDETMAACIGDFVGIKDFRLVQKNISKEKSYGVQYNEFKKNIRLPQTYVEEMLTSRFCVHFFAADELDALHTKWLQ